MKPNLRSSFCILHSAFLIALALLATIPRTPAQSVWGTALAFDGSDDSVQAGDVPLANSSFTLEAWARRHSASPNGMDFIIGQGGGGSGRCLHFGFHYGSSFVLGFYDDDLWSAPGYTDLSWHHWAGTYNATNRLRCLYRDGVLIASNTALANYQGSGPITIGTVPWSPGGEFDGDVEDVRIWKVARTQPEIAATLTAPLSGLEPNLLAYWKFDESNGDTVVDASTNGFSGILANGASRINSTVLQPAVGWGTALSLNGGTQYMGAPAGIWFSKEFTIETWVYVRSYASWSRVVDFGNGANADNVIFALSFGTTGKPILQTYPSGQYIYPSDPIPLNQWVHLAATLKNNTGTIYVNGVSVTNGPVAGPGAVNRNNNYIGRSNWNADTNANAIFDELRIWSVARSEDQLRAGMANPLSGTESNLVAYWKFDEPAGITAYDASPNHRNGTLFNRPIRSPSNWRPTVTLNSSNPLTNECHVPFVDPTSANASPVAIAVGLHHNLALRADGRAVAWGYNYSGQTNVPANATNLVAVAASSSESLALRADGKVVAWGYGDYGQTNVPAAASNVVAIAAGDYHNLALRADGKVIAWGANWYDQTNVPAAASTVVSIAAGAFHSLALKADGKVVAWGNNDSGQTNVPPAATNVVSIAACAHQSLVLKSDGTVIAWGANNYGQTNVPAAASNVVAIAAGVTHSLALRADGTVVGWGSNWEGETTGPASVSDAVAIAAGYGHSLTLRTDGTIEGWGADWAGQATIPNSVYRVSLPLAATGTVNANSPGLYSLSYSTTNALGQTGGATRAVVVADTLPPNLTLLGDNPLVLTVGSAFIDPGASAPDLCMGDLSGSIQVAGTVNTLVPGTYQRTYTVTDSYSNSVTARRTVAVGLPRATTLPATDLVNDTATLHGTANPSGVQTWGWLEWGVSSSYGNHTAPTALGGGTTEVPLSEALNGLMSGLPYHYRMVASNSVGISYGQDRIIWSPAVTLNTSEPFFSEYRVPFVDPTTVNGFPLAIAAGGEYSLALKADGTIIGWGADWDAVTDSPSNATNIVGIAAGLEHNLALKGNRTIIAWGNNWNGQTNCPASATNVTAISAGADHSLALRGDGTIMVWGSNRYNQTNTPAAAANATAISAGYAHNLALRPDGTVVAWGWNDFTQTNAPSNATNIVSIAAGGVHSLALRADGTIVGWGADTNTTGEAFDFGQAIIPANVTNAVAVSAGLLHSLALGADGHVIAWGAGSTDTGEEPAFGQAVVPASATNVVAVAAGGYHSLALRADGTVLGWGENAFGQVTAPAGLNILNLPLAVSGTVNSNVLGTYVLSYRTTNTFGAIGTGTRTVVVCTRPIVTTEPATQISANGVTFNGTANPRAAETMGWFEYGLGASYGNETAKVPLGSSTNVQPFDVRVTGLLPWMTYHYRAVASNGLGRTDGPDAMFTLPGPSTTAPLLSEISNVTLPQGGSASVWITVSPAELEVRVCSGNPVLLPASGVALSGSGTSRNLILVPARDHSGSARVTVTATDGSRSATRTFNVTVIPSGECRSSLLCLTNTQIVSSRTWRFRVADTGTGFTNYTVESLSGLATNDWRPATNVARLPGGVFEVTNGPPQPNLSFYRAKGSGFRLLTAGIDSSAATAEEGAEGAGAVLVFNGAYSGTVRCIWTDQQGTNWTNNVVVNGTTAAIPMPTSCYGDNATVGQLASVTVQLLEGPGFVLNSDRQGTVGIEENDTRWRGILETISGSLDFTVTVLQTNGVIRGLIQSDGVGFFPTNALAQLMVRQDAFTAVVTNVCLPVLTAYPALSFTNYLDLRLEAANSPGSTPVTPSRIEGVATFVSKAPGRSHLDTALSGAFTLLRIPTGPATNEVPLYPVH